MTDYLKLHSDGDDDVTRGLRDLYAAPADDAYWRSLEARILSRLTEAGSRSFAWWDEVDRWVRPMLVAAAVVLLAAGVALFRAREVEQDASYEAMVTPAPLPIETAVRPVLQDQRETTFRYLISR